MLKKVFVLKNKDIIYENFDGEMVVVNLEQGIYYSLNKTASVIWALIVKQYTVEDIVKNINKKCNIINIENIISDFINELIIENLIIESNKTQQADVSILNLEMDSFTKPAFQKFDDMQELLMLDVIHDVDESGWPSGKPMEKKHD